MSSISSPLSILLGSHDLKGADTQVVDVRLCFNVASRPDQRLHASGSRARYHGCYHRNDNVERTCEKNLFLVNFGHPDFPASFESVLFGVMCRRCNPQTNVGKQWGLFTKWRRSGSAGHFCTRVDAGCMAGCVRSRKTHRRRATFCSFCLNTLRVILTDDLCVRRT